jgi:transcriptional regulator with XRE-family HTH domain
MAAGSRSARDSLRTSARKATHVDALVAKRVRFRRITLGLSQHELADKIGVSFQQMQKYETGSNRISASRLFELSKVLKVPMTWFFYDEGRDGGESGTLLDVYFSISDPASRHRALEMLRNLAAKSEEKK